MKNKNVTNKLETWIMLTAFGVKKFILNTASRKKIFKKQ